MISMETFARLLLNGVQGVYDGGVIGDVLRNVPLVNNSGALVEVRGRAGLRMSGGYVATMVLGSLWAVTMIVAMAGLCYLEGRRSPREEGSQKPARRQRLVTTAADLVTKIKAGKTKSLTKKGPILQLLGLVLVMLPLLLLLVLAVTNVALLARSISQQNSPDKIDSDRPPAAMLPALKVSLTHLRSYLSTFADNARRNTKVTVEEIVLATKDMQNKTMTYFNSLLMTRLGVTDTFTHGDEMTRIVVSFFQLSSALVLTRQDYNDIRLKLYPTTMNRQTGLFNFVSLLRDSLSQLPSCDTPDCKAFYNFFHRDFVPEDDFPDTDFASSFLFIMRQRNETPESVQAKSAHGRRAMAATMAKTKAKMDILVDIPGTVRNMTAANWDKMDVQFAGAIIAIDRLSKSLDSSTLAGRVSSILSLVMTLPLLLTICVMVLAITLVCDGARSRRLRLAVYGSLTLLSISLLFASMMFLLGGQVETELCRYLRTDQPILSSFNESRLTLDKDINAVLPGIIRSLPKTDSPSPIPHNVLYGIVHRCRRNEPILVALDAVKSIDTKSLSKPEASEKIVAIGRMLMLESLNETDPRKMMPADMAESLNQASQLDMFKKVDFAKRLSKVPRSPLREINGKTSRPVSSMYFIDRVDKYLSTYGSSFKEKSMRESLVREYQVILVLMQRFSIVTDKTRMILRQMKDTPKIEPVVRSLQKSLKSMLAIMTNKTRLISLANRYYDEVIVTRTPENTAKIMAKFGPKMMSQLGPCRPLFEAYRASVDTVCDVVVSKVNVSWLYLGTMVLILTVALFTIFLVSVRTTSSRLLIQDPSVSKPLVSLPPASEELPLKTSV